MKIATISATEAKNRFGDMIRRAYRGQEHIIVERGGIPVVVILPISDYEQFLTKEQPDAIEGCIPNYLLGQARPRSSSEMRLGWLSRVERRASMA